MIVAVIVAGIFVSSMGTDLTVPTAGNGGFYPTSTTLHGREETMILR